MIGYSKDQDSRPGIIRHLPADLRALDELQLPLPSQQDMRLIMVRRIARQVETMISHHFGHGERTAHYALALAGTVGLSQSECFSLHFAALLHDIGLLTVPAHLVTRNRCLDAVGFALIQSHPRAGA